MWKCGPFMHIYTSLINTEHSFSLTSHGPVSPRWSKTQQWLWSLQRAGWVGGGGGWGTSDTHIRNKSATGVPDDDSLVDVDWCQSVSQSIKALQHQRQHYREIFAAGSYNHVLCSSCMLRLPHPQLSLHSAPCCSDELIDTICHLLSQSEKEREPNREASFSDAPVAALWLPLVRWADNIECTTQYWPCLTL